MPSFSKASLEKLSTVHPDLRAVCEEVVKYYDITVTCGHRNKVDQDAAFADKKSKTPWPQSKHNSLPSRAVDIVPYPVDWNDLRRFIFLAGRMQQAADALGVKIRWGGNWDGDKDIMSDQKFNDLPHFEVL